MDVGTSTLGVWLRWMLTFFGFPLGGGLAYALVRSIDGAVDAAVAGAVAGAAIGTAQWLVLRQLIAVSGWWIAASSVGLAAGLALGVALVGTGTGSMPLAMRGIVTGVVIGIMQWIILREHVLMAGWWVPAIGVCWAGGWTVTRAAGVDLSRGWTVFGASGAIVFAALTGIALILLLRHPVPRP